jgi:hypothetical protein
MILDRVANVYGLSRQSNTDIEYYSLKQQGIAINVQPEKPEYTVLAGGNVSKSWRGYTTYSGCVDGDVVTLSGTTTASGLRFRVRGVLNWQQGFIPHTQLILEESS